jgi:prepilin signal peptidase PulO-like enzyme (type II secretory pathway)
MNLLNYFFYSFIIFSVITDLYDKSVYTFISLLSFLIGLLICYSNNSWIGLIDGAINGFFGYLLFFCLYYIILFFKKKEGLGLGDAEFMLGLSTQLGWNQTMWVLVYAAYASSIVGILYALVFKKKIRSVELPLVPFLFLGYVIVKNFN